MARRGIAHVVILRVDIQREECTQGTMDWHSRLHHRGDKRGGDTVPGNVGYQDTDAVLIDRNEIAKIACHGGHGLVSGKGINVPAEPVKTKRPIPDKPTTSPA